MGYNPHCLSPLEPATPRDDHGFIAADVETDGLGGPFIAGAIYDGEHTTFHVEQREMWDAMLHHSRAGKMIGFHNAEYDLRYFLAYIRDDKRYVKRVIKRRDERIIAIRISRGKRAWTIVDTFALMPVALAALWKVAGREKQDIGLGDGVLYDHDNALHREYLRNDVVMLFDAYNRFCELVYDTFQVYPSLTIGATAIKCIRRTLNGSYWRLPRPVEAFCREAYYGGLTFLTTIAEQTDATQIDANGMYAWAMGQGVPTGNAVYTRCYVPNRPAFYRVIVAAESIPFTFVPKRTKDGVQWAHGLFETVIPSCTYELALQHEYKFRIIEGYYFEKIEAVFETFVSRCWQLEQSDKGGPLGTVIKFLRNSGYGKFGQRAEQSDFIICDDPNAGLDPAKDKLWTPEIDGKTGDPIPGLWYRDSYQPKPYQQVHWAAWITAMARNNLAEAVYTIGPDAVYFGDTDSITGDAARIAAAPVTIGKRYGEYKIEKRFQSVKADAPKCYSGITDDGTVVQRHKGIPKRNGSDPRETPLTIERQRAGATKSTFRSVSGIMAMLVRGEPSYRYRTRSMTDINNSKGWVVLQNGNVSPVCIRENGVDFSP